MADLTQQPAKLLTQEERNDLRKKVLRGESLSLEEARSVYETLRQAQGVSALTAGESKPKRAKKDALSDQALDQDLASLGL